MGYEWEESQEERVGESGMVQSVQAPRRARAAQRSREGKGRNWQDCAIARSTEGDGGAQNAVVSPPPQRFPEQERVLEARPRPIVRL